MGFPSYSLVNSYSGESLLSGFDWFSGQDLSNGFVSYQDRQSAEAKELFSIDEQSGVVRLGVDKTNVYGPGEGRPSIRLESKETYQRGLFIADFLHMPPSQCGVWPAFWTYGSNWPHGGEIDIIEGANTAQNNLIAAHTSEGCFLDSSLSGLYSGYERNEDCYIGDYNIGCGFDPPVSAYGTYGDSFNAQTGGVYTMLWDHEHIKIWHFSRGSIPGDIEAREPNPENWGLPYAVFGGSSCDVDEYFNNMRLVINVNFCGDYGNALWGKTDTCDSFTSYETCSEYVGSSPEDFASTYWDVRYIDVYDLGDDKPNPSNWTGTFPDGHGHGDHHDGPHEWLPLPQITYEPLVNPHSIAEYAYVGCFSCASGSTLTLLDECDDMTLDVCVEHCRSAGKGAYAGVHGRECYCGERIDAERNAGAPGTCDKPCPGGPGSFCGGGSGGNGGDVGSKLLSVYGAVKEEHQPAPPPKAAPLASEMANQNYVIPEPDCPETDAAPARQLAPISPTAHGEPLWSPDERKGFGVRPPLPPPVNGSHLFPGEEGQFGGPPRKPVVIVSLAPRGQPPSRLSILMFGAVMAGATLFV